jgi:hypothetical protein
MLAILKANGEEVRLDRNDEVTLEEAQQLVGGYVEVVPHFNKYLGQECVVLCDEEGKLKHYPENEQATKAWYKCFGVTVGTEGMTGGDVLVGDIVVLTGSAMEGWK